MRCDESAWGGKTFCGYGNCTAAGVCVCEPGWGPDKTFFKADNCWLSDKVMFVAHLVVGIAALLVGVFGLFLLPHQRKDARVYARLSTATMFLCGAYMLAHALEGDEHGVASVILCVFTIAGLSNAYAVVLHALLKPVYMFAGGDITQMKKFFIVLQGGEFTLFVICMFAMIGFIATNNDLGFSYAMATFVVILSLHFLGLLYLINGPTWKVVEGISTASSSAESSQRMNGQRRKEVVRVVRKLKVFIQMSKLVGPPVLVICFSWSIILYAMKSTPFIWVFYIVVLINIPVLGLIQLQLASPKKSSGTKSEQSSANSFDVVASPGNFPASTTAGSAIKLDQNSSAVSKVDGGSTIEPGGV